jgi:hypothetical protein
MSALLAEVFCSVFGACFAVHFTWGTCCDVQPLEPTHSNLHEQLSLVQCSTAAHVSCMILTPVLLLNVFIWLSLFVEPLKLPIDKTLFLNHHRSPMHVLTTCSVLFCALPPAIATNLLLLITAQTALQSSCILQQHHHHHHRNRPSCPCAATVASLSPQQAPAALELPAATQHHHRGSSQQPMAY